MRLAILLWVLFFLLTVYTPSQLVLIVVALFVVMSIFGLFLDFWYSRDDAKTNEEYLIMSFKSRKKKLKRFWTKAEDIKRDDDCVKHRYVIRFLNDLYEERSRIEKENPSRARELFEIEQEIMYSDGRSPFNTGDLYRTKQLTLEEYKAQSFDDYCKMIKKCVEYEF